MPKVSIRSDAGGVVRAGRPVTCTYRVLGSARRRPRCLTQGWRSVRAAVAPPVARRDARGPGRQGEPFLDAGPALECLLEEAAHFGGDGVAALELTREQREDALWVTVSGTVVHLEEGASSPLFTTHLDVAALTHALAAGFRPRSAVVLEGTAGGHGWAGPGEDPELTAELDGLLGGARTALQRAVAQAQGQLLLTQPLSPVVHLDPCPARVEHNDPRSDVALELHALGTVLVREAR